jgi:hypothetical protein
MYFTVTQLGRNTTGIENFNTFIAGGLSQDFEVMNRSSFFIWMLLSGCTLISCGSKRYIAADFDVVPGTRKIIFASGNNVFMGNDSDDSNDVRLEQFASVPLCIKEGAFIFGSKDGDLIESAGIDPAFKVMSSPASTVSQPCLSADAKTLFYVSSSDIDRGSTLESTDGIWMITCDGKSQPVKLAEFYSVSLSPCSNISNRLYFVASERYNLPAKAYYLDLKEKKTVPIALPSEAVSVVCSGRGNRVAILLGTNKPYGFEVLVFANTLGSGKSVYQTRGYVSRIAFSEDEKSILICEDSTRDRPNLLRLDLYSLKSTVLRSLEK